MTPGTRGLVASLAMFGVGLAAVDAGLARYARRHFVPDQLLDRAIAAGDHCVVALGDSRIQAGVDPVALGASLAEAHLPACVAPLGIGALGIEGQSLALRAYVGAPRTPRVVVLGAGPLLPTDPADPAEMVGNRAVELAWSRATDLKAFFPGFPLHALDPGLRFSIARADAIQSYASLVWAKVQMGQSTIVGEGRGPSNKFGLVADMQALATSFAQDANTRLARAQNGWSAGAWFDAIDALAHARGSKVVVVHVPVRTAYRRVVNDTALWRDYAAWLAAELARRGDGYVDLSASVEDAQFEDGVHVNAEGARTFSRALGSAIAPYVDASPSE